MKTTALLAKHIREIYTGGNWTHSNLKDALDGIEYIDAQKSIYGLNSIAVLVNHLHYYVPKVTAVLLGGKLESKDNESWSPPEIRSQDEWLEWIDRIFIEAELFASLIEVLPDSMLSETFEQEKYGNYFRNISGILEHHHYHLGQIVLLRKILGKMSTS